MSVFNRFLDPALVERLNQLQLSARRVVEGSVSGSHRSPLKGASVEFRQHRFYAVGDEPRRLDWRLLARTDRPYIKEYDEETNLRCVLMLDSSGSMAYGGATPESVAATDTDFRASESKFDYAARIVASLAYLMLGQTESVGLTTFSSRLDHWVAPHGGTRQLSQIIDQLERTTPRGASSPADAMKSVADRLERRSLVILLSDCFVPPASIRDGLARLRHDRHETILLQVLHPDEVNFPFDKWTRFRGMEAEPARLCEPAVVKKVYLDNFRRHRQSLSDICQSMGTEFHSFVTDRPLMESVVGFLRRRSLIA